MCCWNGGDGDDQGWQGLSLPTWHHHRRNCASSCLLLFLCQPGHDPLCATEERTRKAERKLGSVQRKNWGRDTLSSDRPASRPEETTLGTEGRAAGPWEGLNLLPVHTAGRTEAPGAAWAWLGASTALLWVGCTPGSAHACSAPARHLPSHPPCNQQLLPVVLDPSSHREKSNFRASGATHEVTVEQMVCRSPSAQLSVHHHLTSRDSRAFPIPSQASSQGPQPLPHPNKILMGWSHFAACWGKFSPLFCRHQQGRKSSSHCVQKWPKSPVWSLIFPGQWPMAKLKISISLAPSTAHARQQLQRISTALKV